LDSDAFDCSFAGERISTVADKKSKSKIQADESAANGVDAEPSLGHLITEARERKGLTREQVATEAHLPPHYVKMIEGDSYDMISDRLYLVPFLRRYATFLGLDAEEIASRFVSNVQHAEANVVRISQEITMVERKSGSGRRIAFVILLGAVILLLADMAWRRYQEHEASLQAPAASPAATTSAPNAQAPNENLPPATVVTNPEAAAPAAAAPPAVSNIPRPAIVPPVANHSAPQHPVPHAATDD
jgi:cytoskeletal protein RodZ